MLGFFVCVCDVMPCLQGINDVDIGLFIDIAMMKQGR